MSQSSPFLGKRIHLVSHVVWVTRHPIDWLPLGMCIALIESVVTEAIDFGTLNLAVYVATILVPSEMLHQLVLPNPGPFCLVGTAWIPLEG